MYSGLQTLQLCVCGAKWGHLFCFNKAGVFLGSDCQAANCFLVTSHMEESSLSRGPTLHRRWPSGLVAQGYSLTFCFLRKAKHVTLFAPIERGEALPRPAALQDSQAPCVPRRWSSEFLFIAVPPQSGVRGCQNKGRGLIAWSRNKSWLNNAPKGWFHRAATVTAVFRKETDGRRAGLLSHSTRRQQQHVVVGLEQPAVHFHNRKGQCCGSRGSRGFRDANTILSGSSPAPPFYLRLHLVLKCNITHCIVYHHIEPR